MHLLGVEKARRVIILRRNASAFHYVVCRIVRNRISVDVGPCHLMIHAAGWRFFSFKIGTTASFILKPRQLFVRILSAWVRREHSTSSQSRPSLYLAFFQPAQHEHGAMGEPDDAFGNRADQ